MSAEKPWIEWNGGICPVNPHTEIEYRLRFFPADKEPFRCEAGYCRWDHGRTPVSAAPDHPNRQTDIVAYRVLPVASQ